MFIDPFTTDWLEWLESKTVGKAANEHMYLFLDGAFVPGLHRAIRTAHPASEGPALLFETLPGCSEEVRDVSPLLVSYTASNTELRHALMRCNGWPMFSAIITPESLDEMKQRLAAWCVVEVDNQRFNFRFPDTRRLPGIFTALIPDQRAELAGPASAWHYIGRDGSWKSLPMPCLYRPVAESPVLDAVQFAAMVDDSEADEVLLLLQDRGRRWERSHSQLYAQVSDALRVAKEACLETELRVDWCEACMDDASMLGDEQAAEKLVHWRTQGRT